MTSFYDTMQCKLDDGTKMYEVSIKKTARYTEPSMEELDLTRLEKYLLAFYFENYKCDVDDALKLTVYDVATYIYDIISNNPSLVDSGEKEIIALIKIVKDYKISISIGDETWNSVVTGTFVYDIAEVISCVLDELSKKYKLTDISRGIICNYSSDDGITIIKHSTLGGYNAVHDARMKADFSRRVSKVDKVMEDSKHEPISDEEFGKYMNRPEADLTVCPSCGGTLVKLSTGVHCMRCKFRIDNNFMGKPE